MRSAWLIGRIPGLGALADLLAFVGQWAVSPGVDWGHEADYLTACAAWFEDSRGVRSRRYFHWDPRDFPLAVYLPPPGAEQAEALHQAAEEGLRAWEERAPGLVGLRFLPGPEGADIAVRWLDHAPRGREPGCYFEVSVDSAGRSRMRVTTFELALRRSAGSPAYSPAELRRVASHEMGHALGLGHSRRPADIMYPDFTPAGWQLSDRDVRTLRRLYGLPSGAPASWGRNWPLLSHGVK